MADLYPDPRRPSRAREANPGSVLRQQRSGLVHTVTSASIGLVLALKSATEHNGP